MIRAELSAWAYQPLRTIFELEPVCTALSAHDGVDPGPGQSKTAYIAAIDSWANQDPGGTVPEGVVALTTPPEPAPTPAPNHTGGGIMQSNNLLGWLVAGVLGLAAIALFFAINGDGWLADQFDDDDDSNEIVLEGDLDFDGDVDSDDLLLAELRKLNSGDGGNDPVTPIDDGNGGDVPTDTTGDTGTYNMGCGPEKNVGEVQGLIGLSIVCLGTEYDAYTWRSVPIAVNANCPQGFICTLHLADGDKIIVTTQEGKYSVVAGTFRRVSGYPSSDAVHTPCNLLMKEKAFGASQTPRFEVFAGPGLNCDGSTSLTVNPAPQAQVPAPAAPQPQAAAPAPQPAAPAPQAPAPASGCPTSAQDAANRVGGSASGWSSMPGTDGTGWKYGPSAPAANLTAPVGRLDFASGSGSSASNVTDATLWCAG